MTNLAIAIIDRTPWHKNCRSVRRRGGKICRSCPFREEIEKAELRLGLVRLEKLHANS